MDWKGRLSLKIILLCNLVGGALPYIGYKGVCGPNGYGFAAVLVINKESILAIFVADIV